MLDRISRARGVVGVWELIALVAVWPYIVAPLAGGWPLIPLAASPTAALSLAVTLALLVACRAALDSLARDNAGIRAWAKNPEIDPSRTLNADAPAEPGGLPGRKSFCGVIDQDMSDQPALLGVFRFANHAAMASFDAMGAARVTATFVRRLEAATGARRLVGQVDHESFGVWFRGSGALEDELRALAYVLAQEISDGELTVAPDMHVGSARFPGDADTAEGLLGQALSSLHPLKKLMHSAGRAKEEAATDSPADLFALEQALRRAVREGQLSLRYQPLIDTAAGSVAGAEVLLRWRHPTFGDVSPARFVPLLEETGLIHDIGLWTLNTACRQLREWRAIGQPGIRLAINLSAIQLQDPNIKTVIARTVAAHGLAPADLELELTETAAMEDRSRTSVLFGELRDQGFGIALDDFGNGHSNLGYLKDLPFTKLKIDREFVTHVDTRPGSQAICKALVELGAGLGISVLAEGVERFEEVTALRRLGCGLFQGYYFARPMTADEFTARLGDSDWLATFASDVHRGRSEIQKRVSSQ